jgi:hypothetical protein
MHRRQARLLEPTLFRAYNSEEQGQVQKGLRVLLWELILVLLRILLIHSLVVVIWYGLPVQQERDELQTGLHCKASGFCSWPDGLRVEIQLCASWGIEGPVCDSITYPKETLECLNPAALAAQS